MLARVPDRPLITVFGKIIIHQVQANVTQFNLIAIYGRFGSSCLYGTCKAILYQSIQDLDYVLARKIELSAAKVNQCQCKAASTKSSILDVADVPDPPLISIFGKVTFNLAVILFSLIAVYRRSDLYGNYKIRFYQTRT